MTTYKLTGEGYVIRDGNTKVPITDSPEFPNINPDYLAYKQWLADGGVPEPYVAPSEPVPQQITRAQGKAALIMQGYWQAVLDYVAAIQDPTQRALAEVALHDTLTWERSSPFLNSAAAGLGMTGEQLDALFIQAAGITL